MHVYTEDVLEVQSFQQVETRAMLCRELSSRLAREVLQLMFAGTDTSSLSLSNAMKYLAKYPEWMTALADEQRHLIEEHGPEITQKVRPLCLSVDCPIEYFQQES